MGLLFLAQSTGATDASGLPDSRSLLVRALLRRLLNGWLLGRGRALVGALGRLLRLGSAATRRRGADRPSVAGRELFAVGCPFGGAAGSAALGEGRLRCRWHLGGARPDGRLGCRSTLAGEVAPVGHGGAEGVGDHRSAQGGVVQGGALSEPGGAGAGGDVLHQVLSAAKVRRVESSGPTSVLEAAMRLAAMAAAAACQ